MKPVATIASSLVFCLLAAGPAFAQDYLARSDVRSFIETMHTDHGLEAADLERVLGAAAEVR